jgi:hypothetical protein
MPLFYNPRHTKVIWIRRVSLKGGALHLPGELHLCR